MVKRFKYLCSCCQEVVESGDLEKKVLANLVHEHYHICPNCNYKHISYYTNPKIRRDIKRLSKKRKRWTQSKSIEESRKLLARIKMDDKLIKKDMDRLKDKMTNGNKQHI